MKAGTRLAVRRMCALAKVNRTGFSRCGAIPRPVAVELCDHVQRVALEWPTYGRRRITVELRRGGLPVIANACNGAVALVVSGLNQLWRADITYSRWWEEFVYLAVVLNAFSRRAIAWALDAELKAGLAVAALEMAFERR